MGNATEGIFHGSETSEFVFDNIALPFFFFDGGINDDVLQKFGLRQSSLFRQQLLHPRRGHGLAEPDPFEALLEITHSIVSSST